MNVKILFISVLLLSALTMNAQPDETGSNTPPTPSGSTDIPKRDDPPPKKRMKGTDAFIHCEYGSGVISLALPAGVQSASFTLSYGDEPLYYGVYFASDRYVTIPDLPGEIAIEITADNGSVYAGILTF